MISVRKSINLFPTVSYPGHLWKLDLDTSSPSKALDGDAKPGPLSLGMNMRNFSLIFMGREIGGGERMNMLVAWRGQLEKLPVQPVQPAGKLNRLEGF